MGVIAKQGPTMSEKAVFYVHFDGTRDVLADLMLYAISKNGHLLDASRIWLGRVELDLSRLVLDESYLFVGLAGDLSNISLTTLGLFSAFGFHEVTALFDPSLDIYRLDAIPETSWRRWISQTSTKASNNPKLFDFGAGMGLAQANSTAVPWNSGRSG